MLGCGFVVAMFFAPIFSSIPGYATGPALVVVSRNRRLPPADSQCHQHASVLYPALLSALSSC
jgi:xanthine/uracil/vitamin C permease (AzgA family)